MLNDLLGWGDRSREAHPKKEALEGRDNAFQMGFSLLLGICRVSGEKLSAENFQSGDAIPVRSCGFYTKCVSIIMMLKGP